MVSLSQYSDYKVSNMCVLLSCACGDWRVRDMVTVLVILPVMLRGRRGGPMLLFLGSAAWACVLTCACPPLPHDWAGGLWCPHGPVGCLLIKTPPIHSSWAIFSIIRSHLWLSGPMLMTRARVPMVLWPPVPLRARAPAPLTSDSGPGDPACARRPAVTSPRAVLRARWPDPRSCWARTGLYLGHPQVLSRGFGRAWEIWPPPFPQHKMEKFWQKWINLIPGDFCQTVDSVTHYSHKLFIVPIFVNTAKCCIKGEHKLRGRS